MAEGTPDSHFNGIHPLLRQRMLNRAATFSEGAQPIQPLRRRSSILSEYSDTRHSFRSSTDNLLRPGGNDMDTLTSSEEASFWHSAPLAFAILPAVGGLLFQNGSAVVTDILLLGFGSMFLNWCVRAPWYVATGKYIFASAESNARDWYHAAQRIEYVDTEEERPGTGNTIPEEDEESDGAHGEDDPSSSRPASGDVPLAGDKSNMQSPTIKQEGAARELAREELLALIACFIGPLLGAYLLHAIRSQLTRPAEGLVSNYNLTIFIMAAELRPVSHIIKMKQSRMARLQRLVRPDTSIRLAKEDAQELSRRLADVEARLTEPTNSSDVETTKVSALVRQGLQPQLDALNRAVRRYEKRQAAQSIQIEARFGELETRLKDALSLAAAAARTGQRPGVISTVLAWFISMITYIVHSSWATLTYPYKIAAVVLTEVKYWFIKSEHQPRKRLKGQSNVSVSNPRVLSRNGR